MSSVVNSEEIVVNIPFIFSVEGKEDINTNICMEVIKNDIPSDDGMWKNVIRNNKRLELPFLVELVSSIQEKDLSSFNAMVHPVLSSDKKQVKEQAEAYFEQFSVLEIIGVKGLFKFSSYQVVFLELKYKDRIYIVDFMFAIDSDGKYKFLPYKSTSVTASTFYSWVHSEYGYLNNNVKYCEKKYGANEKYDVVILESSKFSFKESSIKNKMELTQLINKQNELLKREEMNSYLKTLSTDSKSRISKWLETSDEKDKELFVKANVNSHIFFIIDSKPLFIVFNENTEYGKHVVFYIKDLKGDFKQVNLDYNSVSSRFFYSKLFMDKVSALVNVKNGP